MPARRVRTIISVPTLSVSASVQRRVQWPVLIHALTTVTGSEEVTSLGFEAGDAVSLNISTFYNTSGDVWAQVSSVGSISGPSEGASFWGIQDF